MRLLLGSIYVNDTKAYALGPFERMCEALFSDVDVMVAVDRRGVTSLPELPELIPTSPWATEIVFHGKQALGRYALENGYDGLVWQGIDCLYSSRAEFNMLADFFRVERGIVGGLVAGRNRPDYPVCRVFAIKDDGDITTMEQELPRKFFDSYQPRRVYGYIGSDATIIAADVLERVEMGSYEPWHTRINVPGTIGPDEWFMRKALKQGIVPVCHLGARPWHFHEDGLGARCFGQTKRLEDMRW